LTNSDKPAIIRLTGKDILFAGADRKVRVLPRRGVTPPLLFSGCDNIKELSIFIDESGDFGAFEPHSPFYIVTLVFHDQSIDITENVNHLNYKVSNSGLPDYTVHAGPLIRRENEYSRLSLLERKQIFNFLYNFARTTDITYRSVVVEKKHLVEDIDLNVQITKQLSAFLFGNIEKFMRYDRIIVYYDYGQMELTNILVSVFNSILNNVEFKKILPANYKLFQAADMLCTLELLSLKADRKMLTKSELVFFTSEKNLRKSYLKAIRQKHFK
jgi:hypothetical protein